MKPNTDPQASAFITSLLADLHKERRDSILSVIPPGPEQDAMLGKNQLRTRQLAFECVIKLGVMPNVEAAVGDEERALPQRGVD
jgi:hypothetical protein